MITSFIGASELGIVLLVALIVFGGSKISGIGKSLGQSIREFKSEVNKSEDNKMDKSDKDEN